MAREENYQQAPETIIGATVKTEGDLISEGDIRIDGLVTGKIRTSKNLFVGPTAKIEADIEAQNAVLAGFVKGDVKARESLTLTETGRVSGNIACSVLIISEGAHFTGSCIMPEMEEGVSEPLPEEE